MLTKTYSLRRLVLVFSFTSMFILNGCAAVAIGAYAYVSAEKREARTEFIADFNRNNIEREKNGLEPIDICDAKMHYDMDWAKEDAVCNLKK